MSQELQRRDIRLTRISITIVVIFVACHLPRFIPNVTEIVTDESIAVRDNF